MKLSCSRCDDSYHNYRLHAGLLGAVQSRCGVLSHSTTHLVFVLNLLIIRSNQMINDPASYFCFSDSPTGWYLYSRLLDTHSTTTHHLPNFS